MDMGNLQQGLGVVAAGMTAVFVNLAVLMTVVMLLGQIFGKKPKKKDAPAAAGANAKDAGAGTPRA